MSGPVYRLVVAVVTAVVEFLNQVYGTHVQAADVVSIVVGLIGLALVLADAHVERGRQQSNVKDQVREAVKEIVDALPGIVASLQQGKDQASQPGGGKS